MRIALLGLGKEGHAALDYWRQKEPQAQFVVYDEKELAEKPVGCEVVIGPIDQQQIEADLVVRCSPAIAPSRIRTATTITTPTNEFFAQCPAPIIGVTGTKGKGTTCSLITSILRAAGKTTHLLGNIGTPSLEVLPHIRPEDVVVFELSSFQLWDARYSPHIAIVLGIEPDHLDVHKDYAEYIQAKHNIVAHQKPGDFAYVHPTNPDSMKVASGAPDLRRYNHHDSVYIELNTFFTQGHPICKTENLAIPGAHNLENATAAIAAALHYTQDYDAIARGLRDFKGLPHHIELVREKDGVKFYDDSFSSAPSASVVALQAFQEPIVAIIGGYEKGADFTKLVHEIAQNQAVKKILLIGQTKNRIADALRAAGFDNFTVMETTDFETIIRQAADEAAPVGIVLLSPGCASYDMFKNFYERGDQFKEIVARL